MAMLKFKKGLYANLPKAIVEGTIYVTTDEKAMYVDINNEERIRIGDIIRVNTFNELQPPFSNTAFYYVESSNALLKRVATGTNDDGETIYAWKQINGTKELQDALTALTNRVSALEGVVGSTKSGLVKDVANLKLVVGEAAEGQKPATGLVKKVADNASDIADLKSAINMGTGGTTEGIGATVAQLSKDLDTLEGTVEAQGNAISEHTNKISALETASAKHALKTDLNDYAKVADVYKKTETYTKTEVNSAIDADVLVETNRATEEEGRLAGLIATAQNKANNAYELASEKATLEDVAAVGYALATEVESDIATAKSEAINDAASKYATIKTVETLDGKISKNTSDITKINTALDSVVTKSELEGKSYATTSQVATAKSEAIADAATAAAGLYATKEALSATNENVSAAKSRADNAYNLAEGKTTAAAVKTQIEAYGYATTSYVDQAEADAIEAAKIVGDRDYAAKSIEDIVAGHTSALNILNGASGTAGSVAEAKAAADAAQADIDAWKTAHANDYTNSKINELVADAKKAGTDAAASANANAGEIARLKSAIGSPKQGAGNGAEGNAAASGLYKLIEDGDKAIKTELEKTIAKEINDVNAMDYKGGVGSETALNNILTPKAGDTYVVTAQFLTYYPGDLLIASGEEDEATGTIPTKNLSWLYVKTGYDASLEQKLEVVNNKVQLSSITNANNGQISFESDGSAVTVSVTPVSSTDKNPVVTIGMVWEDFGE